ncbi:MAG TPA: calcium/sodium antiporter [Nocardioides sp.]|uniref:calcium/sodium antiporter n=1 Tax=Nocardioides sp. TaxID=35761 RepID=UPI002E30128F|nr:calcium/sodium antiporter [Nocardioides sp.]HEX5088469.1 calcium/sodium antiporter [Nocardioides sp.]
MSAVAVLSFVAGLALLVLGADGVVRGGSRLAARLGVGPLVIGMTVVSLGTSLPELAIGLSAVRDGNGELAVGNIVGTNLVNTLLVLGIAALLVPIRFESRTLRVDLPAAALASVLLFVLARDGSLSLVDGVALTAYGLGYFGSVIVTTRGADRPGPDQLSTGHEDEGGGSGPPGRVAPTVAVLVAGLVGVLVGAELLVDGATTIALDLGMSDALVGLTIVAVGTSAPELVTTVVSTVRGDRAIAIGNLMGSNVFNIALVLGPTVLASPTELSVPDEVLAGDLVLMVGAALACVPAFWTRRTLSRIEGGLFVGAYLAYIVTLVVAHV